MDFGASPFPVKIFQGFTGASPGFSGGACIIICTPDNKLSETPSTLESTEEKFELAAMALSSMLSSIRLSMAISNE